MTTSTRAATQTLNALLARMQYRADPHADATMASILGPWTRPSDSAAALSAEGTRPTLAEQWQPQWKKLAAVSRTFEQWRDNRSIAGWRHWLAG